MNGLFYFKFCFPGLALRFLEVCTFFNYSYQIYGPVCRNHIAICEAGRKDRVALYKNTYARCATTKTGQ